MSDWIIDFVGKLSYFGVLILTFLENLFPPIPSELIMPLAGLLTVQGEMIFAGAVAAGTTGSLLGTYGWYWLGKRVGEQRVREFTKRHGRWLTIEPEDVERAQHWFERHGLWAVFLGRMVPGLRTLISLPAGFAGMPAWRFLLPSLAGTFVWTLGLTYAGRVLGNNYQVVKDYIGIVSWAVLGLTAAIYIWRQIQHLTRPRSYGNAE